MSMHKNTQHTPGPWGYAKCNCGHPMCSAFHINHVRSNGGFSEEDARLIAAAPELLEALKAAVDALDIAFDHNSDVFGVMHNDAVDTLALARAAIAKAKGE